MINLAIPGAGKTFGPYKFIGSDADATDDTNVNDKWTFSNLYSGRDGPATSGDDMDYAPRKEDDLTVYWNGVFQRGGGNDYTFTAGTNGDAYSAYIVFAFAIDDADTVVFDLRSVD